MFCWSGQICMVNMKIRATMRGKLVFILGIREVPFIENRFTQKPKSCPACKQKARSFYKERGKWTTTSGKKREKRKAKAFLLVIHDSMFRKSTGIRLVIRMSIFLLTSRAIAYNNCNSIQSEVMAQLKQWWTRLFSLYWLLWLCSKKPLVTSVSHSMKDIKIIKWQKWSLHRLKNLTWYYWLNA